MEKDVLSAILEVEREIQERLVAEQRSAWTMLDRLRQELEAEAGREEERLAAARLSAESAARGKAQEQAALIASRASADADRLAGLDDGALEPCIMRHLVRIIPGEER
jgi:cell division septum initiation protein DivIVA